MASSFQVPTRRRCSHQIDNTKLSGATTASALVTLLAVVSIINSAKTAEEKTVTQIPAINQQFVSTAVRITPHPHRGAKSSRTRADVSEYKRRSETPTQTMKFLFLNCQSLNTAKKNLEEVVENNEVDILCLNETWQQADSTINFKNWRCFSRPRGTDNHGGVAIFFRDSSTYVAEKCQNFDRTGLEVVAAKITTNRHIVVHLVVAYIPPNQTTQMELLKEAIKQSNLNNIILMGDFNGKSQEWGNMKIDEHGRIIENMLTESQLSIHNDGQATRRNTNSIIDLVITSANLTTYVTTCDTLTHESVRSDHIPVYSDIAIDEGSTADTPKTYRPLKKVDWNSWREETEEPFGEWLKAEHTEIEECYKEFQVILERARDKVMPEKTISKKKRKIRPCWWNESVTMSKKHLNYCQKTFKKRNTVTNRNKLADAEVQFEEAKEKAQEDWSDTLLKQFDNSKNAREMWDAYKKLTKKPSSNSVLPLIEPSSTPVFKTEEKCEILQQRFFEGKHLQGCSFDNNWKRQVEMKVGEIEKEEQMEGEEEEEEEGEKTPINDDIRPDEVERAICRLRKGKAPGSDGFPPEMFIQAGENLKMAITVLFNLCWSHSKLPKEWKGALVKFLRKPGKSDYYTTSAYRPISLTQTLCKLMETVVSTRLTGYLESKDLLDQEQEGFRKNRSTIYAVGRLVQEIFDGYNNGEITAAVFVDLSSAYDSVWRDGLFYKLSELNIKGRMWRWIKDFLSHRTAKCMMDDYTGAPFKTEIGLPQGSVIAPILFNVYIIDMFADTGKEHCKFADDGTAWSKAKKAEDAIDEVCQKASKVLEWCSKWRMAMNLQKTEATVFSQNHGSQGNLKQYAFTINNNSLRYNQCPKLLGITLDERMTFDPHIRQVARKASRALRVIREVKGIAAKVSTKKLLNLYNTMVRSVIEYGAFIWQGAREKTPLEAIQRKGLAVCLNLPQSSGREAMEVTTGTLPLDLRMEEISIRELAKIQAKKVTHPIKQTLNKLQDNDSAPRYISPMSLALCQAKDMEKATGVAIQMIEPEMDYEEDSLYKSRSRPEYWSSLGSSKNRTKEQQCLGRNTIMDLMMEAPDNTTFAFTDGSCITNPGPCGAGAIIYPPEGEPVPLKRPVSQHGSILLAELVAILMVLEHAIQHPASIVGKTIRLFSDSQSAVGILSMGWKGNSHQGVIREIKKAMGVLADTIIEVLWTPGHAGLQGNDIADELAKEGAQEALQMPKETRIVTIQDVKEASRKASTSKWQTRWDNSSTGRKYYEFVSSVNHKRRLDLPNKTTFQHILQLQTGYSTLNAHRHKIGHNVSPMCTCGTPETTEHYLLECQNYTQQRETLARSLQQLCGIPSLDIHTLLGIEGHPEIQNWRDTIQTELGIFIESTDRFGSSSCAQN